MLTKTEFEVRNHKKAEWKFSWAGLLFACQQQQGMLTPEKERELKERESKSRAEVESKAVIACTFSSKENKDAKDYFDLVDLQTNYTQLLTQNADYKLQNFTDRFESSYQSKTKVARAKFRMGWFDYDIEACAYTLTYQKLIKITQDESRFTTIARAFRDKHNFRNELAEPLQSEVAQVKKLLAIVLFNPNLIAFESTAIWRMLVDNDYEPRGVFRLAKRCKPLLQLISELKLCGLFSCQTGLK